MKQVKNTFSQETHHNPPRDAHVRSQENNKNNYHFFKSIFLSRLKERSKQNLRAQRPRIIDEKCGVKTRPSLTVKKSASPLTNRLAPELRIEPQINSSTFVPRLEEVQRGVVAQAQATGAPMDEINKLIKKMTLGFSVTKNDSSFFMKEGLFAGTFFHLSCDNNDLSMKVQNGSARACEVLTNHQEYLRQRLHQNEINLQGILFS